MDPLAVRNQPPTAFTHQTLFYRGAEEYLAGTVPFIRYGLDRGEPVAVAVAQAGHGSAVG